MTVYGLVDDGVVTTVTGNPFWAYEKGDRRIPLADLRLLPPVIPNTFFCAGLNYRAHAERAAYGGHAVPERPEIGYRANNALTGHLSPIVRPADCDEPLVAEGELVAVIGRPLRHVTPAEARDGIFGWTIGNDVSVAGLAAVRPDLLAVQEQRHVQADGAVHRDLGRGGPARIDYVRPGGRHGEGIVPDRGPVVRAL